MPGPIPKEHRARRNEPARGDWQPAPGVGWQHGDVPKPPTGLTRASRDAWQAWFRSWFAAHWSPELLPGLRQVVRLYDQVERGEYVRAAELRMAMDTYGMTPKGQAGLRWLAPKGDAPAADAEPTPSPYAHLRVVNE